MPFKVAPPWMLLAAIYNFLAFAGASFGNLRFLRGLAAQAAMRLLPCSSGMIIHDMLEINHIAYYCPTK